MKIHQKKKINSNDEGLEKIKMLVEKNKNKGRQIPLLAFVLLLFHKMKANILR